MSDIARSAATRGRREAALDRLVRPEQLVTTLRDGDRQCLGDVLGEQAPGGRGQPADLDAGHFLHVYKQISQSLMQK